MFTRFHFFTAILICLALCSCNNSARTKPETSDSSKPDSSAVETARSDSSLGEINDDYNYADYYVVIADTGLKYPMLLKKMVNLSLYYSIDIETMNRQYDEERDLIALPENDPDEIYAGEYYPRREPSTFLSLEYLDYFQDNAREKTIAIVAGIYERETSADSALQVLRVKEPRTFKVKSHIFIGCMH